MEYLRRKLSLLAGSIFLSCVAWGQINPTDTIVKDPEAWYIHFKTGKSVLELNYNGNRNTLQQCVDRVQEIMDKNEYNIDHIRIVGYASPEGSVALNQRLSAERADALKKYLVENTGLASDLFETVAGGENWNELRVMVEKSDMGYKDRILEIIDHTPEGIDPEIALKKLPGDTYQYLFRTFYHNLRSASSIQLLRKIPVEETPVVKEEVKQVEVVKVETVTPEPQKPSLPQLEPCRCQPPFMAIKTNLAYWAMVITPNLELEAYIGDRFSISAEGVYRWLNDSKAKGNTYNIAYVSPEVRLYMRDDRSFEGHYWGVYGLYGEYDIKLGDTGRQGNTRGLGLSYGYIFKFNRFDCLYFDLGISAGYSRLKYDKYTWYDPCNPFIEHRGRNYWGPTKLKASLVWRF